ncbi:ATP-binding protein [Streptosporangium sp. NPDC006013]|uniref:sensor histidine kinase n=1 Tax=Streptosporangium sp. NPDC006013 TaxID=3155596 RepID=UPI00339FB768
MRCRAQGSAGEPALVQQRGVALATLLGRVRHTADSARIDEAYAESRLLLDELRSVVWQVYPTVLDTLGLRAALTEVAERSAVPATVRHALPDRLAPGIETAVYFVAREAITNADKHAGARTITVDLRAGEGEVIVTISNDGRGGASPDVRRMSVHFLANVQRIPALWMARVSG